MCCENDRHNSCLADILETILMLQQRGKECDEDNSCTRPFLGPSNNIICFNTRLISFYSCCDNTLWTMPFTLGDTSGTSTVFRIESLDDIAKFNYRLHPNNDEYRKNVYMNL